MTRQVKGVLFLDYVRMVRRHKGVDWSEHLAPEDLPYLSTAIDPNGWYPMATFERLGNAILHVVARDELQLVRMWGRYSADQLCATQPLLVARGDAVETLNRFRVLRSTYFDFDALDVLMLHDGAAEIAIAYHMGMPAEEAASYQTLGFFERQLELAGARDIETRFRTRSWAGDDRTVLVFRWD
ncbi:MAG TPA: hypothetical protein VFU21_08530 [Kofleriaceae bacterium]|nr:hypothetical protein [Kofleriaceae bacterium]